MDENSKYRVLKAFSALVIAASVGTIGFWINEGGNASIGDCLYMTIITLSTVGYSEVFELDMSGRIFASFLIIFGMGTLIYFGSTVVSLWVDLDMRHVRRKKRMKKTISNLEKHIIVCGVGTTGSHVVRELVASRTPFVMIENNQSSIDEIIVEADWEGRDPVYIIGDATDDRILQEAGIERAAGLVAALRNDKDNLYIILSAKQINPKLRIVGRATEKDAPKKMLRAGADQVVSPNLIGGMRIASEMIRPQVVEFLDMMLRDMDQSTRIEQVDLPPNSPLVGRKLSETNIRKSTDVLVIAIREYQGKYIYNPGPDTVLTEKATLIVLGNVESVIRLRHSVDKSDGRYTLIN
jgi:voltage-gated potassium channel